MLQDAIHVQADDGGAEGASRGVGDGQVVPALGLEGELHGGVQGLAASRTVHQQLLPCSQPLLCDSCALLYNDLGHDGCKNFTAIRGGKEAGKHLGGLLPRPWPPALPR